jgi:putative intracellular protease/amidase
VVIGGPFPRTGGMGGLSFRLNSPALFALLRRRLQGATVSASPCSTPLVMAARLARRFENITAGPFLNQNFLNGLGDRLGKQPGLLVGFLDPAAGDVEI